MGSFVRDRRGLMTVECQFIRKFSDRYTGVAQRGAAPKRRHSLFVCLFVCPGRRVRYLTSSCPLYFSVYLPLVYVSIRANLHAPVLQSDVGNFCFFTPILLLFEHPSYAFLACSTHLWESMQYVLLTFHSTLLLGIPPIENPWLVSPYPLNFIPLPEKLGLAENFNYTQTGLYLDCTKKINIEKQQILKM